MFLAVSVAAATSVAVVGAFADARGAATTAPVVVSPAAVSPPAAPPEADGALERATAGPSGPTGAAHAPADHARPAVTVDGVAQTRRDPWREPAPVSDHLVLVGDSLAQEADPVLRYLSPGMTVTPKFWGGTAPCDWLDVDLEAGPTSVVVISFTGNSLTDCMSDGRGGHLDGEALVARYRSDLAVLVERARRDGARVVLVGQPRRAPWFDDDREVDGINAISRSAASTLAHVSFVDAGAAVETPDGRYTERLRCEAIDRDCEPDGTVVVRGDGVHFCPAEGRNPCPVWSGGAVRFALAIADAVDRFTVDRPDVDDPGVPA